MSDARHDLPPAASPSRASSSSKGRFKIMKLTIFLAALSTCGFVAASPIIEGILPPHVTAVKENRSEAMHPRKQPFSTITHTDVPTPPTERAGPSVSLPLEHSSSGTDINFNDAHIAHQDRLKRSLPVRRGGLEKRRNSRAVLERRGPPTSPPRPSSHPSPRSPSQHPPVPVEGGAEVHWTPTIDNQETSQRVRRILEPYCQKVLARYGCTKASLTYHDKPKDPPVPWTTKQLHVKMTNLEPKAEGWAKAAKVYPDEEPPDSHELVPNVQWAELPWDDIRGEFQPSRPAHPVIEKFWKSRCRDVLDRLGCEEGEMTYHPGRKPRLRPAVPPQVRVTNLEPKAHGWADTVTVYEYSHKLEPLPPPERPPVHWTKKWPLGTQRV